VLTGAMISNPGVNAGASEARSPRVSIGLPVYNGAAHLEQALRSLLDQSFDNFELIVSDNGSTDESARICASFAESDERVRFIGNGLNRGACWNFQYTFEVSCAQYFMWAAHDDYWHPEFISRCLQPLDENPSIVLSYPRFERLSETDGSKLVIDPGIAFHNLPRIHRFRSTILCQNTARAFYGIYRRSALQRVLPFVGTLGWDRTLLNELALYGSFARIPEVLVSYRWHERSAKDFAVQTGIRRIDDPKPVLGKTLELIALVSALRRSELGILSLPAYVAMALFCYLKRYRTQLAQEWGEYLGYCVGLGP